MLNISLQINSGIERKSFFSAMHSVVLVNSESVGFKSRDIIMLLDKISNVFYLPITVAINEFESFYLIVDSLGCEFS